MDVSKLIGRVEQRVLPWFGGARVAMRDRTLRLAAPAPAAPGWYRFEIRGRDAAALGPAEPEGLEDAPLVRGHHAAGWVISSGRDLAPLGIAPEEEPAELAVLRARRWFSGDLVLESVDFDTEAEEAARAACFEGRGLADVRAVSPSLRLAFGVATFFRAARAAGLVVDVPEIRAVALLAADGGRAAARAELERRERERADAIARAQLERQQRLREAEWEAIQGARDRASRAVWIGEAEAGRAARRGGRSRAPSFEDRVEAVLRDAESEMLSLRNLEAGLVEVGWRHGGQSFFSIIRRPTMQVVDAGFCLDGADEETNLASLPGVAREAIDEGALHVTRR